MSIPNRGNSVRMHHSCASMVFTRVMSLAAKAHRWIVACLTILLTVLSQYKPVVVIADTVEHLTMVKSGQFASVPVPLPIPGADYDPA